ncbi:hypothetical protein AB6A40_006084 [Gnathostoma spinigerum]|uniref:Protein Wnt n=1 Tax=Gnathostoma spinigerum TaxID=75299 RepID=A0ABD6EIH4_9BILA
MIVTFHFYLILSVVVSINGQDYNWLSLALSSSAHHSSKLNEASDYRQHQYHFVCEKLPGLNPLQISLCEQHPSTIPSISRGAYDSLIECQLQFKFDRWNCSEQFKTHDSVSGFRDLLGRTLRAGNKESAFLSALTSAGVVHAVTKGCSSGNLSECGCDNSPNLQKYIEDRSLRGGHKKFSWGGCSDNTKYAIFFAKEFLDSYEKQQFEKNHDVRHLVAIHNNFVGREVIVQNMRKHCRCHGVSGSCEFRTCWLQIPKFSEVAHLLKQRYKHSAVQVAFLFEMARQCLHTEYYFKYFMQIFSTF